jgi:hypothetical protein
VAPIGKKPREQDAKQQAQEQVDGNENRNGPPNAQRFYADSFCQAHEEEAWYQNCGHDREEMEKSLDLGDALETACHRDVC